MSGLIRISIIVLAAFYLVVVYLVANPNVSPAYRDYYILRTASLSDAQRKQLQPLQIGRPYTHRDSVLGFDGWSWPEETHRWSNGKSAKIVFRLDAKAAQAPQRLALRLASLGTQRTRWRLNGTDLGERRIGGEAELVFPVKPGLLREGENVVEIELPDARLPGNGDARRLALAFKSLELE